MEENKSVASDAIWAVAMVLIVAIIAGVLYYSGILRRLSPAKQDINIKIDAPATPAPAPSR